LPARSTHAFQGNSPQPTLQRNLNYAADSIRGDSMSTANHGIAASAQQGEHIHQVVQSAERELRELLEQRAHTVKRIGAIKQTLVGMSKIFGESILTPDLIKLLGRGTPQKQPGFTRACRVVLMESGCPLEARQGCRELQKKFPELFGRHKDPVASVTTVFNRLVGYSEARSFIGNNGRRMWEWAAEPGSVPASRLMLLKDRAASPAARHFCLGLSAVENLFDLPAAAFHSTIPNAFFAMHFLVRRCWSNRWLSAIAMFSLAWAISCQPPPQSATPGETQPGAPEANSSASPGIRDLSRDEAAGGHVLKKHVGQSDDELRERLRRERNISGASTYTDRATAERAIGAAIAQNRERIQRWLERPGKHANLTLDYESDRPIGRTLNRGDSEPKPCPHALVVLKYADPSYYVLTSYPECR